MSIILFIIVFLIVEALYYRYKWKRAEALRECKLYRKVDESKLTGGK